VSRRIGDDGTVPTFRSDDGLLINYRSWGEGDVPVVLHHGFAASGDLDWVQTGVVDALLATGRRVVAPDARGHGHSDKPHEPQWYGEARMARDVSTLLDVLDAPAADLAGYSMGAIVSLLTAVGEPRIRRLVVGGIGASAAELGGVDRSVLAPGELREALLTAEPATIADPGAAAFRAFADSTGADRQALAAHAASVHAEPIPLERIRIPSLVLAGRDDQLARRPEVLAAAITGAGLQVLDGDHGGVLRNPQFTAALVGFLSGGPA
jgi:pimeloyl-ACP methyl ester carboxylesterase